jgi:WD40 repeat protein
MSDTGAQNGGFQHDVFISYSRVDAAFARALQRALESYRPPRELGRPVRSLNVFRDEKDFTGVEYHESIRRYLGKSAKLIVICSPAARQSAFVNEEIQAFAEARGAQNIIPILRAGSPSCDVNEAAAAFPPALCAALAPLPVGPDYRNLDERRDRVNRAPFQDAWFGLLANLLDMERAELEQRDLRRQRQRLRVTLGITVSILAVLSIALVFALSSRQEAIRERGLAEQRLEQARAGQLMTEALSLADTEYDTAVLLALEATRRSPTIPTWTQLQELLNRNREFASVVRRHHAPVLALQVSDEGTLLGSVDEQGTVVIGERAGAAREQVLPLEAKASAAAFTPDGTALAVAIESRVEVWSVSEPKRVHVLAGHSRAVTSVAFSPDGKLLASSGWDGQTILWDVEKGQPKYAPLTGHTESEDPLSLAKGVRALAFSADGKLLATTGGDNTVMLWDVATGRARAGPLTGHGIREEQPFPGVRAVAFSPREPILATGGNDTEIRLWDIAKSKALGEPLRGHRGAIQSLVFFPNGTGLISADEFGEIRIWSVGDGRPREVLRGYAGRVRGVVIRYGGSVLSHGEDGKIIDWRPFERFDRMATVLFHPAPDAEPRHVRATGRNHYPDLVWTVEFSPSGRRLASGADDGSVVVWEVGTEKELARFACQPAQVFALEFSPDESLLACAGLGTEVVIRDLSSGEETRLEGGKPAGSLHFSSDGATLVAGYADGSVLGWSVQAGKPLFEYPPGGVPMMLVGFRDEGRHLLAVSSKGHLAMSDASSGEVLRRSQIETTASTVAWDEDTLAFWTKEGVQFWSISKWAPTHSVQVPGAEVDSSQAPLALRGSRLATAARGMTAKVAVWDARTGAPVWPLLDASGSVSAVAFNARADLIAAGGMSPVVPIWSLDPKAWADKVCQVAGRSLTREEWQKRLGDAPYHPSCESSGQ